MKSHISIFLIFIFTSVCEAEVNINDIKPGAHVIENWHGLPVIIYKRTTHEIDVLSELPRQNIRAMKHSKAIQNFALTSGNALATDLLITAALEALASRSIQTDILVVLGVSTNFQCYIETDLKTKLFIDPCSNALYDKNGRIQEPNARENYHLLIPPHYYQDSQLYFGHKSSEPIEVIDFSPDVMAMPISNGQKLVTALMWKKDNLVPKLLEDTNVVSFQTPTGATALHVAAAKSSPEIVAQLIQAGFNVNLPTKEGRTPLQMALLSDNLSTAKLLLNLGASTGSYCIDDRCTFELEEFLIIIKPDLKLEDARNLIAKLNEK